MEYVRLGNTGLKISKVILGCMTFGSSSWQGSPWVLDEEDGLKLLKAAYDQGINTWDTADTYSNGESEVIIGKALKKFNIPRQKVVILSKIFNPVMDDGTRPASINDGPLVNQMGLSRKHVFHAVDKCLERLGTDYIDVLQIHRLDRETPPEEIMRALHDVVQSGKVRYIGASSMYTWEFARLQYIAQSKGWTPFISMQPFYNLLYREEEREMLPFCEATGVGVIPWSPIARGLLAKPLSSKNDEANQSIRSQSDKKTETWFADANLEIAHEAGVAHHTQLTNGDRPKNESRVDQVTANDDVSGLDRRQEGTGLRFITCEDSEEMDRASTDNAVRDLVNQCGNGRQVQSGHHIYSVRGIVAVFYCNYVTIANSPTPFGVWGTPQTCYGDRVWNIIVGDTSGKCGSFKPGWSEDVYAKQKNSVGYHEVGGDKTFCGEGHF
ncbi:alcohol dehydrogenase [Fusarium globosum]|uniref:Alcohol dehydrogenase n=1 Tax=Fusarium globosum TaxID=78864 RepID=A0A8H5Z0B8_9HYPO|nr:alcohol dehydrogenase [Fusarium globosum]